MKWTQLRLDPACSCSQFPVPKHFVCSLTDLPINICKGFTYLWCLYQPWRVTVDSTDNGWRSNYMSKCIMNPKQRMKKNCVKRGTNFSFINSRSQCNNLFINGLGFILGSVYSAVTHQLCGARILITNSFHPVGWHTLHTSSYDASWFPKNWLLPWPHLTENSTILWLS